MPKTRILVMVGVGVLLLVALILLAPRSADVEGGSPAASASQTGASAGPWPTGRPEGPGLSPGLVSEVLVAPFNDLERTTEIIERNYGKLAAVIFPTR